LNQKTFLKLGVQVEPDADEAVEAEPVIVDGRAMDYADARALKETYLARLKKLEFDTKRAALAPVADMVVLAGCFVSRALVAPRLSRPRVGNPGSDSAG
jgi:hypothetical protein